MNGETKERWVGWVEWVVRRNPTYLISAAFMAVGARLLLVHPHGAAGDIRLILLTLGVLQVYEWAVSGVLLLLHRAKRAPEDEPSLLLVAALFWTGPLAATIEMTVLRPDLGTIIALGACVIAVAELRLTCRILALRLTLAGQVVGTACLVLLAAAAPLLRIPSDADGTNELYLYAAWWVLGLIVLPALRVAQVYRRETCGQGPAGPRARLPRELAFLAMTVVATGVHLVGMNHAFYCHAAWFYASPVIIAVSIVGLAFASLVGNYRRLALVTFAALPGTAIVLAFQRFDVEFPVALLPAWLGDPMLSILPAAAGAWWFGYFLHRKNILLHAGNAALGLAAFRAAGFLTWPGAIPGLPVDAGVPSRVIWVVALYLAAVYLLITACWRRSRAAALAALTVHLAAVVMLVWGRSPADHFVTCLGTGWSVFIGLHLVSRRPSLLLRLAPILFLVITPWTCESAPLLRWEAGTHALAMMVGLFLAGQVWPWTHYRWIAVLLAAVHIAALAERWAMQGTHPAAPVLVLAGFLWLAGGAVLSWHKDRLVDSIRARRAGGQPESPGP